MVFTYNENFPLALRRSTRKIPGGIETLQRRGFRKLFNAAKKSGNWTDYKSSDYDKVLR
jgi:hypothetical protein